MAVTVSLCLSILLRSQLLAGQSSTPPQKSVDVEVLQQGATATSEVLAPATYVLQPGDELEIKVFNIPELDTKVTVRPDGRISTVLVNDIPAAGLTSDQLSKTIAGRYTEFYRDPRVTVIVRSFTSQRIYIGGEVFQPGMLPIQGEMTVLGAVFRAGGLRDTARRETVVLLRNSGKPEPLLIRLNLREVMEMGKPDTLLKPYDVVYVPKTTIAKLDQFVSQYIKQLLPISANGGFTWILGQQTLPVP